MPRELTLGALFCRISGKAAAKVNSRGRPINPWEAPPSLEEVPFSLKEGMSAIEEALSAIEEGLSVPPWKVKGSPPLDVASRRAPTSN